MTYRLSQRVLGIAALSLIACGQAAAGELTLFQARATTSIGGLDATVLDDDEVLNGTFGPFFARSHRTATDTLGTSAGALAQVDLAVNELSDGFTITGSIFESVQVGGTEPAASGLAHTGLVAFFDTGPDPHWFYISGSFFNSASSSDPEIFTLGRWTGQEYEVVWGATNSGQAVDESQILDSNSQYRLLYSNPVDGPAELMGLDDLAIRIATVPEPAASTAAAALGARLLTRRRRKIG